MQTFALAELAIPLLAATPPRYFCGAFDPAKLTSVVYVSATSGTAHSTCGTSLDAQCRSIAQGIANCRGTPCAVLVAYDRYELNGAIAIRSGVDVYGGCAMMGQPDSSYASLVTAPPGGMPAFVAANLAEPTTVQGFAVLATPAVTPRTPSTAFRARNTKALTLSYLTLSAANGAPGENGRDGNAGANGGNAGVPPAAGTGSCGTAGGAGGTQHTRFIGKRCQFDGTPARSGSPGSTGMSAPGGAVGDHVCYGWPKTARPGAGHTGASGGAGTCGAPGTRSTDSDGSISNGSWVQNRGGNGGNGGGGGGGGGGGAGGGCGYTRADLAKRSYHGMEGGGGGAGGCGGVGGTGGAQGGPSFALFVDGGTVIVNHSTIVGATGGAGGNGGNGGPGGAGGSSTSLHSSNPCNARGGSGGMGGSGGAGGAGGGGAGGNGGPAIGIAETRGSKVRVDAATKFHTGAGGLGGRGGSNPASPCPAVQANDGANGLAADRKTY